MRPEGGAELLNCDFMVVSRAEAEQERRQPQLRDDVFARLNDESLAYP